MTDWNGKKLGEGLARFLQNADWMVWTQLPLGPIVESPGVADLIAVAKSFSNRRVRIYELKVSRSDFLRDVETGKYKRYLDFCTQFYFAAPAGLIAKADVPDGCGLITLGDHGWHVLKAPRCRDFEWKESLLLRLLIRGYDDYFPRMRQINRELLGKEDVRELARIKGSQIAHRLANAEEYIQAAEDMKRRIDEALGVESKDLGQAVWVLRSQIEALLRRRSFAEEAVELAEVTMNLFSGQWLWRDSTVSKLREIADSLEKRILPH